MKEATAGYRLPQMQIYDTSKINCLWAVYVHNTNKAKASNPCSEIVNLNGISFPCAFYALLKL